MRFTTDQMIGKSLSQLWEPFISDELREQGPYKGGWQHGSYYGHENILDVGGDFYNSLLSGYWGESGIEMANNIADIYGGYDGSYRKSGYDWTGRTGEWFYMQAKGFQITDPYTAEALPNTISDKCGGKSNPLYQSCAEDEFAKWVDTHGEYDWGYNVGRFSTAFDEDNPKERNMPFLLPYNQYFSEYDRSKERMMMEDYKDEVSDFAETVLPKFSQLESISGATEFDTYADPVMGFYHDVFDLGIGQLTSSLVDDVYSERKRWSHQFYDTMDVLSEQGVFDPV